VRPPPTSNYFIGHVFMCIATLYDQGPAKSVGNEGEFCTTFHLLIFWLNAVAYWNTVGSGERSERVRDPDACDWQQRWHRWDRQIVIRQISKATGASRGWSVWIRIKKTPLSKVGPPPSHPLRAANHHQANNIVTRGYEACGRDIASHVVIMDHFISFPLYMSCV